MKKKCIEIGVFFIAIVLACILFPFGIIYSLVFSSNRSKYFYRIAYCIDQLGNIIMSELFNRTLKKPDGYRFGWPDETLSSVLGKNYRDNTLTFMGEKVRTVLDRIDNNHVTKSIEEDEILI